MLLTPLPRGTQVTQFRAKSSMHWPRAGIIISILILEFVIVLLTEIGIQAVIAVIAGKFRTPYKRIAKMRQIL